MRVDGEGERQRVRVRAGVRTRGLGSYLQLAHHDSLTPRALVLVRKTLSSGGELEGGGTVGRMRRYEVRSGQVKVR